MTNFGTAGVGTGAGASGPFQSMYACPNVKTEDYDVFIHAGPGAAFRAPGHPQGAFALESAIDELAVALKVDPLELRDKIEVGDERDRADAHRIERKIGAERIDWAKNRRNPAGSDAGPVKRGVGVAQALWYRFTNRDSACEVKIGRDGSVQLFSAVQDIGGGIKTVLAQCVAEELGLRVADITITVGDTRYPPGPPSGGSVTTGSISPAARNAAYRVKQMLLAEVAPALGVAAEDLAMTDGKVVSKSDPSKSMTFAQAAAKLANEEISAKATRSQDYAAVKEQRRGGNGLAGVQFAQVAVDVETGIITVEKVVAVHDCGRPMNPLGVESQINGGVIQGISYALYEDRLLDPNTGRMVNPNFEQYKIVGSKETPIIEPLLIEEYWGKSSTDAAGIGEPATVPTAAAIANAVYNATGVRIRRIPMTPAVVLAAIKAAQAPGRSDQS
jgi:xanthine dehydrogenase YagR molybdenum-binding subunit